MDLHKQTASVRFADPFLKGEGCERRFYIVMIRTIKTKQFKITAALLALVLTVSCVLWNTTKVHALEITGANTEGYTVLGGGTVADGKLTNASIGVYVVGGSADRYNGANIQWTHDGSAWDSETDVLYEGSNSQQQISAYYPYIENYTSGGVTFDLTAEQSADTMKADDLLYAAATELSNARTAINFEHLMTKLNVSVTSLGSEIEDGDTINKVEISGLAETATFYPEDGTLTAGTELNGSTVAYDNGTTYEALVFPAACSTVTVKVTMNSGKIYSSTVSLADINNELAGGYRYNISLQVGQDNVTIGSITAMPWGYAVGGVLETE